MNVEKTIPIIWGEWNERDVMHIAFYDVVFIEDFGIFKKGDKFASIDVDYGQAIVDAYNDEGTNVIKTQNFKAIAI